MVREPAPASPPDAMLAMKNFANSVLLLYLGNSALKRMRQDEHVASNYSDQQDRSTVAESRPRPRHGRGGPADESVRSGEVAK